MIFCLIFHTYAGKPQFLASVKIVKSLKISVVINQQEIEPSKYSHIIPETDENGYKLRSAVPTQTHIIIMKNYIFQAMYNNLFNKFKEQHTTAINATRYCHMHQSAYGHTVFATKIHLYVTVVT